MIDFTNKCVITESDVESAKLLKMAISQGFALPKGEKVMESCRFFRFIGSPYKSVIALSAVTQEMYDRAILYSHLFGNELEELMKISDLAARWCRTYGYNHLSVYANEETDIYTGRGIAKNKDGAVQDVKIKLNNSDLKRAASQDRQSALLTTAMASQTQQLINAINPAAVPAYVVPNPNTYYGGCNGYNNGCC